MDEHPPGHRGSLRGDGCPSRGSGRAHSITQAPHGALGASAWAAGASLAEVQPGCEGVIFARGSRFGGHALCVQDGKLIYLYSFLGVDHYRFECEMPKGRANIGVVFTKEREEPKYVPNGTLELRLNKKVVASGRCARSRGSSRSRRRVQRGRGARRPGVADLPAALRLPRRGA